ncbi:MAG: phosphomethylpyrimidine synthase ThiC [Candidatus Omnitrophica bacterium]|nr:phosphomethylpyrimidine synthase ThiC [Candidatus Omnitrophota bacterium]MBU4478440.1 phosphomethylpyrimidine synthase ThiC [Candidatus Omnitrophota bacterium]MCG2704266.1 phosphomethylpyrimidine synthase ThiC [Candidatus Omnitrophota bacterium]
METIIAAANAGKITPLMRKAAKQEKIALKLMAKLIGEGKVVIPANTKRQVANPCAIGKMMRVKINANIGTSPDKINIKKELVKLSTAIKFGADTVMDLSIGGEINKIQKLIVGKSSVPVGTVPIYEAAINAAKKYGTFLKMNKDDMLDVLVSQAENGVDFFTIHAGITRKTLASLKRQRRLMGIVSRGGAITAKWIEQNKQENPFYAYFDEVLQIAGQYDITLSLGDGLRPGTIYDATDKPQIDELKLLGLLAKRALRKGVQVMIEGPGHIPINQIKKNIELQKKFCGEAPFYVLGPLVTDSALGYDHIAAAIGSGLAATYGADFLCFVTPAEHLKLPDIEDIKLGVIASRIAAHAADLARGNKQAWEKDRKMSLARKKRDWDSQIALSIDPHMVELKRSRSKPKVSDACTMCGDFCSIRLMEKSRRRA